MRITRTACLWIGIASTCALLRAADGDGAPVPQPQPPDAAPAREAGILRTTRRGEQPRAPRVLEHGEPDPEALRETDAGLEEAIILIQEKDYTNAVPLLEKALSEHPTLEPVWEALGWSYYHVGRVADADKLWQQYVTLRPDSPKAHSMLGQLAILRSDWKAVDVHLQKSLELDPKNYDIRYWYAQNLFRLGRLEKAFTEMDTLVAEDPLRFDVKVDLARICTLTQRYDRAADLWTEIVDEIPDNLNFRTEYARALMLVGSIEESDEQARQILSEDPTLWPVMNLRADIAELSQEPEAMVASLQELIDDAEDDAVRTRLRLRLAVRYVVLNGKDPAAWPLTLALEQYSKVIDAEPDNVPWNIQYAQLAIKAKQTLTARRTIDRILRELNPNNHHALRARFELDLLGKDFDAAERSYEELYSRYQPNDPYRFLDLARLEVQRGNYRNAMDALDRLEEEGNRGTLLTLAYHGLTESEWMAMTSTRRFEEHLVALKQAGFSFLAPSDVPNYLANPRQTYQRPTPKPWLARQIANLRYAFTGKREQPKLEDLRPEKVVVVTFDEGLRSSFSLGTPIAQELGIPFGMFVMGTLDELNAPLHAAWEELRDYHKTGLWEIGSFLMHAHEPVPLGDEPTPTVHPLPNRAWNASRNRLETMREWTQRVRGEFADSRARIERNLELTDAPPLAVAYPFGDIGQEDGSNLSHLVNPIRTLLNEAIRQYQVGFVMDRFGYTCSGDNLLMVRRFEPKWDMEATDLVEHALSNHPLMIARRMRAEIATLMQKPYLAAKQVELLRRDGYPERLLRELIDFTQNRSPDVLAPQALDEADRAGTSRWRFRPSNAYLAAAINQTKSNEQILMDQVEFRGGLNLNAVTGLEILLRTGSIEQTISSNFWFKVDQSETLKSRELRTETVDGVTEVTETLVDTTTTREVQTNRVEKYDYAGDVQEIRGSFTFRIDDRSTLVATVGQKSLSITEGQDAYSSDGSQLVGSLTMAWKPYRPLQLVTALDRDVVPSARRLISYDSFALNGLWKVSDEWDMACNARYWTYEDDNAMVHLLASSFWQVFERQGIWGGLEASTYSMDDSSPFYWSPYWDTRIASIARMRRAYQNYFFQFDIRLGFQDEEARPEDRQAYNNLRVKAASDGNWYPGENPDVDWDLFVGMGCTYRQRLGQSTDLIGNLNVNFLRDYSEHTFSLGLQYNF